jgi:hypothetical protein
MFNRTKASVCPLGALVIGTLSILPLQADPLTASSFFQPNNLIVSRSVYAGNASTVTIGEQLPPNCPSTAGAACNTSSTSGIPITAVDNGEFPNLNDSHNVWKNAPVDGSFGVTSPIYLDQITTDGNLINTLPVLPTQIVTSFSSKSELALNLSLDGNYITFMGYLAGGANVLDASNANTTGVYDPTNPVGTTVNRAVAQMDANGNVTTTTTYAYSGNNGRAAILANGVYYTVGNDNNGSQPTAGPPFAPVLQELINTTGVGIIDPNGAWGNYTEAGTYAVSGDKPGKDTNFRGIAIFHNTLYVTKGSGSNGVDTVYQVGTAGQLPTETSIGSNGGPFPMTILPGFPTAKAKTAGINNIYPFGIWFANANTLYVADEGDGTLADAPNSIYAGLQKWIFNGTQWNLAYVMQNGLHLGVPYSVPSYPTSLNPATDGLRNLTGRVNADGTVTIWAVTSTVSTNGDQGADPNMMVRITDVLASTTATNAQFSVVVPPSYGTVIRGVSFTPGTVFPTAPGAIIVTSSALSMNHVTHNYNGTLSITNNATVALTGAVTVALTNLPPGVTLPGNPPVDGSGNPEIVFTGLNLSPGQSASTAISFSDTSGARIQFTPVVSVP